MKRLLRGVIDFRGTLPPEDLEANLVRLARAPVEWVQPPDRRIYKFLRDFHQKRLALPSDAVLLDFFTKTDDPEAVDRLKEIAAATPYTYSNYSHVLEEILEDARKAKATTTLKQALDILNRGLSVGEGRAKKRLEGVDAAFEYVTEHAAALKAYQKEEGRTVGELIIDPREPQGAWTEFVQAERDPPFGVFTGFEPIDRATRGLRRKQLWLHAAFTGGLKSTLAVNWAVRCVTRYGRSCLFFSLEMPFEEIRSLVYCLHSHNGKWQGRKPLNLDQIRRGKLSPEDRGFFRQVLDDIERGPSREHYGLLQLRCPPKRPTMAQIWTEAERVSKNVDLDMVIIDHSLLVEGDKRERDPTERANQIFVEAKQMANSFNNGKGIGVLMTHQINREGAKRAENNGQLRLFDLSRANEAERSPDIVTVTWADEAMRADGQGRFSHLKMRGGQLVPPFDVDVHPDSRLMTYTRKEAPKDIEEILDGV